MSAATWELISYLAFGLGGALFFAAVLMFFLLRIPAVIGDLTGKTAAKQIEKFRAENAASGRKSHRPSPFNLERGPLTEEARGAKTGRGGKSGRTGGAVSSPAPAPFVANITPPVSAPPLVSAPTWEKAPSLTPLTTPLPKEGTSGGAKTRTDTLSGASVAARKTEKRAEKTSVLSTAGDSLPTEFLNEGADPTAVLNKDTEATAVLNEGADPTAVLNEGAAATAVLNEGADPTAVLNEGAEATAVLKESTAETAALHKDAPGKGKLEIVKSITHVHTDEQV